MKSDKSFGSDQRRYANIPEELKALRQWVCYRLEKRNDNLTKVPYRADKAGRRKAKSNDPATWHTFEEVLGAVSKPNNRFNGIGFMLSASDPYVFIDFDHVVTNGEIEEWPGEVIEKIGSYTEFSQSGTGIHILTRAKKPGPRCRTKTKPQFEIYENVRLVVFTGSLVPGLPAEIMDSQPVVDALYFSVFGDDPGDAPPKHIITNPRAAELSDFELINQAISARNGDKFGRLWNGNKGDYNGDHSAADMALCCMLAFWTQRDSARMDRLFRESGLMRDKWDQRRGERKYGEMTIDAAIQQTSEVVGGSPHKSKQSKVKETDLGSARNKIAEAMEAKSVDAVLNCVESLALLPPGEYADKTKELKKAVPEIDLRTLKGEVSKFQRSKREGANKDYAELVVNNRQLRDMGNEAIRLLNLANVPPELYVRSGALCQIVEDERGRPLIRTMTDDILLAQLAKSCDFVNETQGGRKNVVPPKSIASYVRSEGKWPFPALEGITRSPTIRPDGSIAQTPGYDEKTRLFYHRVGGGVVPDVPDNPTRQDVDWALKLIDELFHDFLFDCSASKANAIAMLLSPLLQSAIEDATPLILIDAPTAGSGKSLLAVLTGIITSGAVPDFTTAPSRDEEWPKKITAILSAGPSLVVFDNVKYALQSAELAMLLTTKIWQDRVFGKNTETIALPNRAVWLATGNNIQLGGDIPRRCIWIRIDPKQAKPHEREGFLHPNLKQWVVENRGQLLCALLTVCRAWYAAGCPAHAVPAFGSYDAWTKTIGCILAHAGVTGFLENRDRLWEQADMESTEWEMLLTIWLECYGSEPVTPKQLVQDIESGKRIGQALPVSISDAVNSYGDKYSRVGFQLRSRSGKRHGSSGFRLERGPRKNTGITWRVLVD